MTDLSKIVKPLEWDGNGKGNYPVWWAMALDFRAKIDKGASSMYGDYPLFINGFWDKTKHKTIESAKAAAQAEHARRSLANIDIDALIRAGIKEGLKMGVDEAKSRITKYAAIAKAETAQ
jgi:hypothetical protein